MLKLCKFRDNKKTIKMQTIKNANSLLAKKIENVTMIKSKYSND